MQKITPYLWFDNNAEEAINFYTSVFSNAKIKDINRWGAGGPVPEGVLMTATMLLEGQEFMVLNGGPMFKFTEAVSFFVKCETQQEVDMYWEKLAEGGQIQMCGWLKDKYGLSWQIIPNALGELMKSKEPGRAGRVMQAMLKMKKIIIKDLEQA